MTLIFKLSTGEHIIGNIVGSSPTGQCWGGSPSWYELSYPAVLGQNGLEPYMGFGMGKVTLYTSNIVASTVPVKDILDSYNAMFGPTSTSDLGCTKE